MGFVGVSMHFIKGVLAITFMTLNAATVWVPLAIWIVQSTWTRGEKLRLLKRRMDNIILWWAGNNRRMFQALKISDVQVTWEGQEQMSDQAWYLVVANHQSWTDIVILQSHLYGVIPPLKFFTKETLIWVPFIGVAMKVLGFPYVKRATKAQIKANPELRNADRDNTLAACAGFQNHPTCVLNFVEGTRRTAEKQARQSGEFAHLLRPKIGGLGYVIEGMEGFIEELVDVTIVYPDGVPTFWAYLQGKCPRVIVHVQAHSIPRELRTGSDVERKSALGQWINALWRDKDARIGQVLEA
ncbi:MAG: acetyltransferase [Pseudomonadota bacterium]